MARPGKRMVNRSPPRSSGVHDSQKILLQNGQWATCVVWKLDFFEKSGFLPIQCTSGTRGAIQTTEQESDDEQEREPQAIDGLPGRVGSEGGRAHGENLPG